MKYNPACLNTLFFINNKPILNEMVFMVVVGVGGGENMQLSLLAV